jgi:vacuolar-type H+-ATPase subunit E/Vma4
MALEDIFRALEEQSERDIEVALEEARAHALAIREESEREAATVLETRVADAERAARARSSQALNSVRLDARKRIAGVKERAVRQVFEEARAQLTQVRKRPDYDEVFRALLDEALAGVSSTDLEIWVDPADAELAQRALADRGVSAPVRPEISTAGGVVVATEAGRVMRRNTLEDRLDKLEGLAQSDVAELVFQ